MPKQRSLRARICAAGLAVLVSGSAADGGEAGLFDARELRAIRKSLDLWLEEDNDDLAWLSAARLALEPPAEVAPVQAIDIDRLPG